MTTAPQKRKPRLLAVLGKPWTVALAVMAGVGVGLRSPATGEMLRPLGNIYMSFLAMCALPIIILSIVSCVGRAVHSGVPRKRFAFTAGMFVLGGAMASGLGIALMLLLGGDVSDELRSALGRTFMAAEQGGAAKTMGPWDLLGSLVPNNIFSALSGGQFLACVFFSMMIGAALGFARDAATERIILGFSAFGDAFYRMMRWGLLFLAPGLFCMVAGQFAGMRLEILTALGRMIALFFLGCALLCLFYALALRRASGQSWRRVADSVAPCAGVAFVAASSTLAIPLAFEGLERGLRHKPEVSRFILPMGVAVNRQAFAMLFSMTAVFVLRLQGGAVTPGVLAAIGLCSVLAGMPAIGSPAVIAPMLTYVLAPVGLPTSLGVGILAVISPMIDSLASMTNLVASCAVSGIVDSLERGAGGSAECSAGSSAENVAQASAENSVDCSALTGKAAP